MVIATTEYIIPYSVNKIIILVMLDLLWILRVISITKIVILSNTIPEVEIDTSNQLKGAPDSYKNTDPV